MSSFDAFLKSPIPNTTVTVSDADIKSINESSVSSATRINKHLDSKFVNLSENMERQITAIEDIAQSASKQANSAYQQIEILKDQLAFTKSEAESARKEAIFAKVTSVIAIIISVVAIIVPQLQFEGLVR